MMMMLCTKIKSYVRAGCITLLVSFKHLEDLCCIQTNHLWHMKYMQVCRWRLNILLYPES